MTLSKKQKTKFLVADVYMCKNCHKHEYQKRKLRIWCVWCRAKDSIPQFKLVLRERYVYRIRRWNDRMNKKYKEQEPLYIHKLKMQTVNKLHLTKHKK